MFGNVFTGWHLLALLAVILLLFGAAKLPALAKSVGQSAKVFRKEIKDIKNDDEKDNGVVASSSDSDATRLSNVTSDAASSKSDTEPKS